MGGGGKGGASMPKAAAEEAPKPYLQEQQMEEAAQSARDEQVRKAKAALGQEGSVLTSPFGSQEQMQSQKPKTLLG